jgi:hypothetical protein
VFASPKVRGLYERLFAEAWPVELNPGRFLSDEARMPVLGRTAGILLDLEAAICRELGRWPYRALNRASQCRPGAAGAACPAGAAPALFHGVSAEEAAAIAAGQTRPPSPRG